MIFLHGGGDKPTCRDETFGRFIAACSAGERCSLLLVVVEETLDQAKESFAAYQAIFKACTIPPDSIYSLLVTPNNQLTADRLAEIDPTGLFVCGGTTPLYHQLLCEGNTLKSFINEKGIPYGGTSAGAAIAAQPALLGGWRSTRHETSREMLFVGASEGLGEITLKPGLELVPFTVDVHASQMGTLTRLIHAVELGLTAEGWAIDENTVLQINKGNLAVYGEGHVYRVWRNAHGGVELTVHV